jgi:hypothetical protein
MVASQTTLRCGCQARLTPSVDMTSDVKGWEQLFSLCLLFFSFGYRQSWSQSDTTVEHADIRGLAPTFRASVGCLPHARDARPWRPPLAAEGDTTPGLPLFRERGATSKVCRATRRQFETCGGPGTCVAMAHMQALHARAMAPTP